jgi:catalase (peroxidase I)
MMGFMGGMRVLKSKFGQTADGVVIDRPETLTAEFFMNLLDMATNPTALPAANPPDKAPYRNATR